MQNPKKLFVTTAAERLIGDVYRLTSTLPRSEQYNLVSQMRRSATSIKDNIYEGCGRGSNRWLIQFLQIAHASAQELCGQLRQVVSLELGDLSAARSASRDAERLRYMIWKLITAVQRTTHR